MGIRTSVLVMAALVGGGCGGDMTELEGVYTFDTWTQNDTGCEGEGPSVLEQQNDQAMYLEVQDFFGREFLNAVTCVDVATCQAEAATDDVELFGGWLFVEGSDDDGWTGEVIVASGVEECSGSLSTSTMTGTIGEGLRIETRTQESAPFSPNGEGECDTDDAREAALDEPCVSLQVVTATFDSGL